MYSDSGKYQTYPWPRAGTPTPGNRLNWDRGPHLLPSKKFRRFHDPPFPQATDSVAGTVQGTP